MSTRLAYYRCIEWIHVIDDGDEVQLSAKASVHWSSMCVINNLVQLSIMVSVY